MDGLPEVAQLVTVSLPGSLLGFVRQAGCNGWKHLVP
jgi:hypothetical protein